MTSALLIKSKSLRTSHIFKMQNAGLSVFVLFIIVTVFYRSNYKTNVIAFKCQVASFWNQVSVFQLSSLKSLYS